MDIMVEDAGYVTRWKFSRADILTILYHYHELKSGQRITSPSNRYNNPEAQWTGRNLHAIFEEPCLLAAEVYSRVKSCGYDGYIVMERFGLDKEECTQERIISESRGIPLNQIYQSINFVVRYCQGRKRKKIPYFQWKKLF